jgi:nicotinate phosphoribosyltransferase
VRVDGEKYFSDVRAKAKELCEITGSGDRVFEVGLRAASCFEQHLIALEAVKEAGIRRTSNVAGARAFDMWPVGTMGHEHIQRYGSDLEAFRAMRDRRPARSSYLLDTFDAMGSGIPAALSLIALSPSRRDSVRYDSGDQVEQMKHVHEAGRARGLSPVHILEDGYDAARTREMEALRESLHIDRGDVFYGYGGSLVARGDLTRDRVAAVYKLTETDGLPVMKFAVAGKRSVPGRPVVWRRINGEGPLGVIAQEGETLPEGYALLTGGDRIVDVSQSTDTKVERSPRTLELERACEERVQRRV